MISSYLASSKRGGNLSKEGGAIGGIIGGGAIGGIIDGGAIGGGAIGGAGGGIIGGA
tara:strand:- start:267 stop:437 length:171 start_codon:yes stop_codon:yes gene_type:complete